MPVPGLWSGQAESFKIGIIFSHSFWKNASISSRFVCFMLLTSFLGDSGKGPFYLNMAEGRKGGNRQKIKKARIFGVRIFKGIKESSSDGSSRYHQSAFGAVPGFLPPDGESSLWLPADFLCSSVPRTGEVLSELCSRMLPTQNALSQVIASMLMSRTVEQGSPRILRSRVPFSRRCGHRTWNIL